MSNYKAVKTNIDDPCNIVHYVVFVMQLGLLDKDCTPHRPLLHNFKIQVDILNEVPTINRKESIDFNLFRSFTNVMWEEIQKECEDENLTPKDILSRLLDSKNISSYDDKEKPYNRIHIYSGLGNCERGSKYFSRLIGYDVIKQWISEGHFTKKHFKDLINRLVEHIEEDVLEVAMEVYREAMQEALDYINQKNLGNYETYKPQ